MYFLGIEEPRHDSDSPTRLAKEAVEKLKRSSGVQGELQMLRNLHIRSNYYFSFTQTMPWFQY
jgi:hypothetical protein